MTRELEGEILDFLAYCGLLMFAPAPAACCSCVCVRVQDVVVVY